MITKNGSKIIGYAKIRNTTTSGLILTSGEEYQDDFAANSLSTAYNSVSKWNLAATATSTQMTGMVMNFGVGTTQPTVNDYWLDETEVDGVDINDILVCQGSADHWNTTILDDGSIVAEFVFQNSGETPITIREIGVSYLHQYGKFLVSRIVLPAPRTVQPSEVFSLDYHLNLLGDGV